MDYIQKTLPNDTTFCILTIYGIAKSDILSAGVLTLHDIIKIKDSFKSISSSLSIGAYDGSGSLSSE